MKETTFRRETSFDREYYVCDICNEAIIPRKRKKNGSFFVDLPAQLTEHAERHRTRGRRYPEGTKVFGGEDHGKAVR